MRLNFKGVLAVQTDAKEYKPTIITFVVSILCLSIFVVIANFIPVILLSRIIMVCLIAFGFYLIVAFFSKLIFISENIEKQKVKDKVYNFKYKSIFVSDADLIKWLNNYSSPECIVIKLNEEYHYIEISYDTKGRRGKYINRNTYYDDMATKVEDIEEIIKLKCKDGKIEVFETYDHQNPQLLVDEINDLK